MSRDIGIDGSGLDTAAAVALLTCVGGAMYRSEVAVEAVSVWLSADVRSPRAW